MENQSTYQNIFEVDFSIIPDINADGSNELLIANNGPRRQTGLASDSYIYFGETSSSRIDEQEPALLIAANPFANLGSDNSNSFYQYQSAVGFFDEDSDVDLILPQRNDLNFLRDPLYHYELETEVTTKIAVTSNIGSAGGIVKDSTTGAMVDIPENALENTTNIEIGTFSAIPQGLDVSGTMYDILRTEQHHLFHTCDSDHSL